MAFDAVIPAYVRYSKECCMGAKMLYGEIRALSYSEGYCWAGDEHLAKLYDVSERTVRTWLMELKEAGFIIVEAGKNQHGQRRLTLSEMPRKKTSSAGKKLPSTLEENFQAEGGVYKDEEFDVLNTPLIPQKETKVKRNAKPTTTVTQHFGENPICPAEFANDASTKHGFSQERIDAAFTAFYDHHASKGTRFADHRAAFRTWCTNEVKFAARSSSQNSGGMRGATATAACAVLAERYGVQIGDSVRGGGGGGVADIESGDTDFGF